MDFRCCVYDKLYRKKLVLLNRGGVALKMQCKVPRIMKARMSKIIADDDGNETEYPEEGAILQFHPSLGFIQGRDWSSKPGSFEVQIKFRPTESFLRRCASAGLVTDKDRNMVEIPISVDVPDQT